MAALDGHVYAWSKDGTLLEGFPVPLARPGSSELAKSVSTPAVGDIDGDGRPEIVVGSNELRDGFAGVYAVRATGRAHPGGPFLPGWAPLELPALRADLLPTMASGVHMTPSLVNVDDDPAAEVALYAVTGSAFVLVDHRPDGPAVVARLSLAPGEGSALQGTTFLGGTGSPLLADTDGDGISELYAP